MTAAFCRAALGFLLALGLGAGAQAQQPLRIEVTDGQFEPMPIALPNFIAANPAVGDLGARLVKVVTDDLVNSGLFRAIPPAAHIERVQNFNTPPGFPNWRAINARALVTGEAGIEADGRLSVKFRLWDVFNEQQLVGLQFFTEPGNWRGLAHKIADQIYTRLTGEGEYFHSRIVFVAETGPKDARQKRLAIMDQDGENLRYLTGGAELVLTPRFSPTEQEITYIAYHNGEPQVFLLNLDTGQQELVGRFPGMTFAPRFSPDGRKLLMSLSTGGDTNIVLMDLATRQTRKLTNGSGINTGGSFAPDGSKIVFESDRGGSQQLYVMDSDGSNVRRISFGEGRYATPVWSPRGDLIAFTKMQGGKFSIGVMRPDGSEERLLSSSFLDEAPTWAPNGRVLMFFREVAGERGGARLMSVDVTGRNLREVRTPAGASDPAWSPLLK